MSDKPDDTPAKSGKLDMSDKPKGKPANVAPDAVKDPNEKTEGKPGMGPQGERKKPGGDADPGGA